MMKSGYWLIQQIVRWGHKYSPPYSWLWAKEPIDIWRIKRRRQRSQISSLSLLLILSIVALTSIVGYRFYNQPQLTVGKIAPVTIKAPHSRQFEDTKTTQERRTQVQTGIVPILKQNREQTLEIKLQLAKYLERIENLRKSISPFPIVEPKILPLSTQQYLRACPQEDFKAILKAVEPKTQSSEIATDKLPDFNLKLPQIVSELQNYRRRVSTSEFEVLLSELTLSRYHYQQEWQHLQEKPIASLSESEIVALLDLTDTSWQDTKIAILLAAERILTQGIPEGMPYNLLEETVAIQIDPKLPTPNSHIASNILLKVLQPNLEEDSNATRNIAEKAAMAIDPVIVEIERGETIVQKGETITQAEFVMLDGFGLSRRTISWLGLESSAGLVASVIGLFVSIQRKIYTSVRRRDYLLLCLLSLSAPLLNVLHFPYINLAAIGLLVSSFYTPGLAVTHISLLTTLVWFSTRAIDWQYLLAGSVGGLLAASLAGKLRSREAMARLGVIVGLAQGGVYFITHLILSASPATIWSAILPKAIIYGSSGLVWSIVAIGLSPYLERGFDLITPIRLAELSNPNLPLLKRLATEAPGTFQHTMFVASLAEAAARELNCNVELVRAGTLYHDIGKMHDPLGFIENQMGGANKHDEIDDPWQSAELIKKHVTEGLVMARKYGLPKAIRNFIPEHQGTLLIAYFYYQAKQKAQPGDKPVLEPDFRYAGPIPQSRESGIIMLADGCEAALRSMRDVTPKQALVTIEKIFKARWQDSQLIDSGLSYEELPTIADVFVRVWQQFNHKRIAYPKAALEPKSSE
jgi:cyclic-di-AMP phosphodiesterase PgpH